MGHDDVSGRPGVEPDRNAATALACATIENRQLRERATDLEHRLSRMGQDLHASRLVQTTAVQLACDATSEVRRLREAGKQARRDREAAQQDAVTAMACAGRLKGELLQMSAREGTLLVDLQRAKAEVARLRGELGREEQRRALAEGEGATAEPEDVRGALAAVRNQKDEEAERLVTAAWRWQEEKPQRVLFQAPSFPFVDGLPIILAGLARWALARTDQILAATVVSDCLSMCGAVSAWPAAVAFRVACEEERFLLRVLAARELVHEIQVGTGEAD